MAKKTAIPAADTTHKEDDDPEGDAALPEVGVAVADCDDLGPRVELVPCEDSLPRSDEPPQDDEAPHDELAEGVGVAVVVEGVGPPVWFG